MRSALDLAARAAADVRDLGAMGSIPGIGERVRAGTRASVERLDRVLLRHLADLPEASRTKVQEWIEAGLVTVNGRQYLANRIVWLLTYGEMPRYRLKMRDGDLGNLRLNNIISEEETWRSTSGAAYQREWRRRRRKQIRGAGDGASESHREPPVE